MIRREISKLLVSVLLLTQLLAAVDVTDSWGNRTYAAESGSTEAPASTEAESTVKPTAGFQDITESYAKKEIKALTDAGILSGYSDDRFAPEQPMTRAELAKIIVLASGLKENPDHAASFSDVDPDSWYRGFVGSLVQSGITQGTSDTTFSPEERVTREQLVVLFIRAMSLQTVADQLSADLPFTDRNAISAWARSSVLLASKIGFVQGMENGDGGVRFEPGTPAQRQALARLAYEFHKNRQQYIEAAQKLTTTEPKKEEAPKEETPAACCFGGGGGGGGGKGSGGGSTSTSALDTPGTINGNASISSSGTYGPKDGSGIANVMGTLVIDPGPNAEVVVQNVTAANLEVRSGSSNTIKLRNVHGELLIIKANQSQSVRVMTQEGTEIKRTEIRSKAIIEQEAGSFGAVMVATDAANQNVELRGTYNEVTTAAEGVSITMAPTASGKESSVKSLSMQAGGKLVVQPKAAIEALTVSKAGSSIELDGLGKVTSITFNTEAQNAKLNILSELLVEKLVLENVRIALKGNVKAFSNMILELKGDNAFPDADPAIVTALKNKLIDITQKAIDSIGEVKQYSSELEEKIATVDSMLKTVLKLGANESEIANLSKFRAAQSVLTDLALAKASEVLQIEFKQGDQLERVTQNITLPKSGFASTTVNWETNDSAHVTKDGVVTRPAAGSADATVKLTAVISRNEKTIGRIFTLTIKALPASGTEPTNVPTVITSVYSDTAWITVWTEANANLTLTDARVQLVGKATADSDGNAIIPLRKELAANEQLQLVAQGNSKLPSTPVSISVQAAVAPTLITAKPLILDDLYEDRNSLQIRVNEPSVIWLQSANGTVLDAQFAYGRKMITSSSGQISGYDLYDNLLLNFPLITGEAISIKALANGKKPSGTVVQTIQPINGKTQTPEVHGKLYAGKSTSTIQVTVERDAVITLKSTAPYVEENKILMYTGDSTAVWEYRLSNIVDSSMEVTAKSPSKQKSDKVTIVTENKTELSESPLVYKEDNYKAVTGLARNQSLIQIKDKNNQLIDKTYVMYDPTGYAPFYIAYDYDPDAPLETIYATVTEQGKNESNAVLLNIHRKINQQSNPLAVTKHLIFEDGGQIEFNKENVNLESITMTSSKGRKLEVSEITVNNAILNFKFAPSAAVQAGESINISFQEVGQPALKPMTVVVKSYFSQTPLSYAYISINEYNFIISGQCSPGATIEMRRVTDGKVLFGPEIAYNGYFEFRLSDSSISQLQEGDQLEVSAKLLGYQKNTAYTNVIQANKSQKQELKADVYDDGGFITAVLAVSAGKVFVKDDRGSLFRTGSINEALEIYPQSLRKNPKWLAVYVQESGRLLSDPVYVNVQPVKGVSASPTDVVDTIKDQTKWINGKEAEESSFYLLRNSEGLLRGISKGMSGVFTLYVSYNPEDGEELFLSADAVGKKESTAKTIRVIRSEATNKPILVKNIHEESQGIVLKRDQSLFESVIVTDSRGYLVGYANPPVLGNDEYYIALKGPFEANTNLYVRAKDFDKNFSEPLAVAVNPAAVTPSPFEVVGEVYEAGGSIKVRAPSDATVFLKTEAGLIIGTGTSTDFMGYKLIEYNPRIQLAAGAKVLVTAKQPEKKESKAIELIVKESPFTDMPAVSSILHTESNKLTGKATPGSYVKLSYANGDIISGSYTYTDGTFYLEIYPNKLPFELDSKLLLTAKIKEKKESMPLQLIVQKAPKTPLPEVTKTVYNMSIAIEGTSEPNTLLILKDFTGKELGRTTTYSTSFSLSFYYNVELIAGDKLYLTAKGEGKSVSDPYEITVIQSAKTQMPTISKPIARLTKIVEGISEPDSYLELTNAKGNIVGIGNSNNTSQFTLYINYVEFTVGEILYLTARAKDKSTSYSLGITVQASPKSATPTVNGAVYENGLNVLVITEPKSLILVKSDVDASAKWQYTTGSYDSVYSIQQFQNFPAGSRVMISVMNYEKEESDPIVLAVKAVSDKMPNPTVTGSVYQSYGQLSIKTEPYAKVIISRSSLGTSDIRDANLEGWAYYNTSNLWGLQIGEELTITAEAIGRKESDPVRVIVKPNP